MQRVDLTDAPDDLMAPDLDLDRGVRTEELTELVWAAAAGLNGRDQALLDLHLRQGLEGQDLADAMGTSLNNSYVMLSRMRDQVERSLGALLIARLGPRRLRRARRPPRRAGTASSPRSSASGSPATSTAARSAATSASPWSARWPSWPRRRSSRRPALLKARVISSIRNVDVVDGPHVPFTKEGFAVLGPEDRERRAKAGLGRRGGGRRPAARRVLPRRSRTTTAARS